MAKKIINSIEYALKGELVELADNIVKTQIIKKEETIEDTVDLSEMLADIDTFCKANTDKNVEFKFSLKVTEE